uniref:NADH-ubiquinone oxidoreductase chain 4 n=2 Tax=Geotria australis TaxID=71168 RepID=A0A120HX74_9VERT|nr:NADH dehydrogenase subunit 4 [Geotria australis]AMB27235.1 NADH dehydrogenase subunit 4 [Geotria australis]WAB46087.1 NADH dehydrogenase subunit 4 [Geotria australis]
MLKIILPSLMLIPVTFLINNKNILWTATVTLSSIIALTTSITLNTDVAQHNSANMLLNIDQISCPLIILSCWLLPLTILASQNHMKSEPLIRQKTMISQLIALQVLLCITFGASNLLMFYITFETTLIPTLLLITRWGNQKERFTAGLYFLFYTLSASLPLLLALINIQTQLHTLSTLTLPMSNLNLISLNSTWSSTLLWLGCFLAFLIKMPLYIFHLWLPKAHVEAPIAGSMILAAILLKLGGYGMMRMTSLLIPLTKNLATPFMVIAMWGMIMTSSICLRQTDLKSMIAYSSISHMGLVIAGTLTMTPWAWSGALAMMIAHGLVSSGLFCLANITYERTHTRSIFMNRGLKMLFPLMTFWWLMMTFANMALPPFPNFMAEIMIISAMFNWSDWTMLLLGLSMVLTALFSLNMLLMTQHEHPNKHAPVNPITTREHLLLLMHTCPLFALIVNPTMIML